MQIEKNAFVELTYSLRTDGADGPLVEQVDETTPLRFVFGAGLMLAEFEAKIEGLEPGKEFAFTLTPEEAYGERNDEAVVDIPKSVFIINGELREDLLQLGQKVPMMGEGGQHLVGLVLEVTQDTVKMDFNHELAGETLYFTGKVINVREATAEELINGGRKGCGGCGGGCHGGCGGGNCGEDGDCSCGCN